MEVVGSEHNGHTGRSRDLPSIKILYSEQIQEAAHADPAGHQSSSEVEDNRTALRRLSTLCMPHVTSYPPYPRNYPLSMDRQGKPDPCCLGNVTSRLGPIRAGKALGRPPSHFLFPFWDTCPMRLCRSALWCDFLSCPPVYGRYELLLASRTDAVTRDGQFRPSL